MRLVDLERSSGGYLEADPGVPDDGGVGDRASSGPTASRPSMVVTGDSQHVAAAVLGVHGIVRLVYAERQRDTPVLAVDWPAGRR